jgi:hypothetical protein
MSAGQMRNCRYLPEQLHRMVTRCLSPPLIPQSPDLSPNQQECRFRGVVVDNEVEHCSYWEYLVRREFVPTSKRPPCRLQKRRAFQTLYGTRSVQALNDRTVDREARTLKCFTTRPSDQTVLHEGENLELFTYLSPEPLVDGILGPFEQL